MSTDDERAELDALAHELLARLTARARCDVIVALEESDDAVGHLLASATRERVPATAR